MIDRYIMYIYMYHTHTHTRACSDTIALFCLERTHSVQIEHVLSTENTFCLVCQKRPNSVKRDLISVKRDLIRQHITAEAVCV
jgi:hypothetical protein